MIAPFQIVVEPTTGRDYALSLMQLRDLTNGRRPTRPRRVGRLQGSPLQVATEQLLDALRRDGHRTAELNRDRRSPIDLGEESGVRLGLLFLALRPLSKVYRMERIAAGVREMPTEEALYWFSKCSAPDDATARRSQRAFRVLLAPE